MSMIEKIESIFSYYKRHPDIYDAINTDRNFEEQLDFIGSVIKKKESVNFLELFAGPAYHCICAEQKFNWNTYAVDFSGPMKDIAISQGFKKPEQFIVGALPDALNSDVFKEKLDCIYIPRYSIGYISRTEVLSLFNKLKKLMHEDCYMLLEMHDIAMITQDLSNLHIKERTAILEDGRKVTCTWPDGAISWESDKYMASMPVKIEIDEKVHRFVSKECIYSAEEIYFLAGLAGFEPLDLSEYKSEIPSIFPDTSLVSLKLGKTNV